MKKGFFTLLLLIFMPCLSLGAPNNTSGPWGVDASAFNSLEAALLSPSTIGKTVKVTKNMNINSDVTTERSIDVSDNVQISVAAGKNVNINGKYHGDPRAFIGDGTVIFGPNSITESNASIGDPGRRYRLISGVIRNSGTGWALIDDSGHRPQGISAVSVVGGAIHIDYNFTATKVGSLLVVPDETLANEGLLVGSSVNDTNANIYISAPFNFAVNLDTLEFVNTYPYVQNKLTLTKGSTSLLVTHPSNNYAALINTSGNFSRSNLSSSLSGTTITIAGTTPLSGYNYWDGSAWQIISAMSGISEFSYAWSGSTLTVTHAVIPDGLAINVTPRGPYTARVGVLTTTSFEVQFYTAAGALVTTPDTNCRFYFTRGGRFTTNTYPTGYVAVNRGYLQINPNDLVSPLGNFWIYGVMEY